jgi:hypothetical protein
VELRDIATGSSEEDRIDFAAPENVFDDLG